MKIAIPTNDRKTLAERSGRAVEFAVIDINSTGIQSIEYKTNEHEHTHHSGENHNHNQGHGHEDIVALLKGIDIVIGKKFGPHFSKDFHNAGIKMKITKTELIEDAVEDTFNSFK